MSNEVEEPAGKRSSIVNDDIDEESRLRARLLAKRAELARVERESAMDAAEDLEKPEKEKHHKKKKKKYEAETFSKDSESSHRMSENINMKSEKSMRRRVEYPVDDQASMTSVVNSKITELIGTSSLPSTSIASALESTSQQAFQKPNNVLQNTDDEDLEFLGPNIQPPQISGSQRVSSSSSQTKDSKRDRDIYRSPHRTKKRIDDDSLYHKTRGDRRAEHGSKRSDEKRNVPSFSGSLSRQFRSEVDLMRRKTEYSREISDSVEMRRANDKYRRQDQKTSFSDQKRRRSRSPLMNSFERNSKPSDQRCIKRPHSPIVFDVDKKRRSSPDNPEFKSKMSKDRYQPNDHYKKFHDQKRYKRENEEKTLTNYANSSLYGPASPAQSKKSRIEESAKSNKRRDRNEKTSEVTMQETSRKSAVAVENQTPTRDEHDSETDVPIETMDVGEIVEEKADISPAAVDIKKSPEIDRELKQRSVSTATVESGERRSLSSEPIHKIQRSKFSSDRSSSSDGSDNEDDTIPALFPDDEDDGADVNDESLVKANSSNHDDSSPSAHKDDADNEAVEEEGPALPVYYPATMSGRSIEEYYSMNKIEEGTYGVVYRAIEKRTSDIVAIKRLKVGTKGFPITSLREIGMLIKANQHKNVVRIREVVVGSCLTKVYLVMDFVEHDLKNLMDYMSHHNLSFEPGQIKTLMRQLLNGVDYLHNNWILHRDLKTSNLLLSHQGILKIGDFGLARHYGSPLKPYTPIVVTLWYRAPELLLGIEYYSTEIDMWSVGCIFAELIQLKPFFTGRSEIEQLQRIYKVLGTPNEKTWPGYNQLATVRKFNFSECPGVGLHTFNNFNSIKQSGLNLMSSFLHYDPVTRITAADALKSSWFFESPLPVEPEMFPTYPARSERIRPTSHNHPALAIRRPPSPSAK